MIRFSKTSLSSVENTSHHFIPIISGLGPDLPQGGRLREKESAKNCTWPTSPHKGWPRNSFGCIRRAHLTPPIRAPAPPSSDCNKHADDPGATNVRSHVYQSSGPNCSPQSLRTRAYCLPLPDLHAAICAELVSMHLPTAHRLTQRKCLASVSKRMLATASSGVSSRVPMSRFDQDRFVDYAALGDKIQLVRQRYVPRGPARRRR